MTLLEDRIILKQNDLFAASELDGDIPAGNDDGMGLYRSDTRFLSTYELRINGSRPILLSSSVDRAYVATFQLVNPSLGEPGEPGFIPRQSLSIRRTRFVHNGMHERIGLQNWNAHPVQVELCLHFAADFLDIFEVRGYHRSQEMGRRAVARTPDGLRYDYLGLDQVGRRTQICFDPVPERKRGAATFQLELAPQERFVLLVDILPQLDGEVQPDGFHFDAALSSLERTYSGWNAICTHYSTDNEVLDSELVWRNQEDLRVICDDRSTGLFPTAGLPWYAVPFGRDALITSFQTLAFNPDLARGSLRYLARRQGTEVNHFREEEPGKILHEMRFGELANLKQIPHTPYYGTVDATPLFLVLLVEFIDWTGETAILDDLRANVSAALEWIDRYGDHDGDGFVEYSQHSNVGVRNQGWKDSFDSLMEGDQPAPLPAALVEVQGYVYHAKAGLARILRRLGRAREAEGLQTQADELFKRFNGAFWMPELGFYAQALDGEKRQVRSITSNAGHCLWSRIATPERGNQVVNRLVAPDLFSGWGIRTVSSGEPSYNPMSYHNGSVWPHDNSIIAVGMRRYDRREAAELVARSVMAGCMRFSDKRVPELFCGFTRDGRFGTGPGEYLVSCSPQAWGAGALFHFLQTLAGVQVDALAGRIKIDPLPSPLYRRLRVEGMRVADGQLDFTVRWTGEDVQVKVDRQPVGVKLELPA